MLTTGSRAIQLPEIYTRRTCILQYSFSGSSKVGIQSGAALWPAELQRCAELQDRPKGRSRSARYSTEVAAQFSLRLLRVFYKLQYKFPLTFPRSLAARGLDKPTSGETWLTAADWLQVLNHQDKSKYTARIPGLISARVSAADIRNALSLVVDCSRPAQIC